MAAIAGCVTPPPTWPLPTGLGGVFGDMVLQIPALFLGGYPRGPVAIGIAAVLALPAAWLFFYGAGMLDRAPREEVVPTVRMPGRTADAEPIDPEDDDDGDDRMLALGAITHWWLSVRAFGRRITSSMPRRDDPLRDADPFDDDVRVVRREPGSGRMDPAFDAPAAGRRDDPDFDLGMVASRSVPAASVRFDDQQEDDYDRAPFDEDDMPMAREIAAPVAASRPAAPQARPVAPARVEAPAPRPQQGARVQREAQTSLIAGNNGFEMPTLHFLAEPKNVAKDPSCPRMRWSRTPACSRECWRISASRARSSMSGPDRW